MTKGVHRVDNSDTKHLHPGSSLNSFIFSMHNVALMPNLVPCCEGLNVVSRHSQKGMC